MHERDVEENPHTLFNVPDQYLTKGVCNKTVKSVCAP